MQLMNGLTLTRSKEMPERKIGTTCSGESCSGNAVAWNLLLPERPPLTVHDTSWRNDERDLVLYQPTVVPEMPAALSNVHNRLRSGISGSPNRTELRLMVYPTYVDELERPRVRKSFSTVDLEDYVEVRLLRKLTERRGVTLETPPGPRGLQYELYFPAEDHETPVVAFVHFRIVPVLRHVGWLPREGA